MAIPPPPSNLDFEQCIRGAYEDEFGRLRVDASITAPIDMNGEVLVDIRAEDGDSVLLAGTTNGLPGGPVQYVKVNPDGSINVDATLTVTSVDQGNPNTINNAWPVKLTDGTDTVDVNPDGSINVANITNVVANNAFLTSITSTTSSQLALPADITRKGFILLNYSNTNCFVAFAATATTSAFSILLIPGMTYQNEAIIYTGDISCIWDVADGFLKVTKLV